MSSSASLLISIRLDPESQRHLRVLEASGLNRSEAIREALRGAAERMSQRDSVRKEAEMVAADQQDRFEMQETAQLFNMLDRGVLSPGMKADINVINYEQLGFSKAEMAYDFPTGARRLVQRGHGYELTMVSGVATVENDEFTGALPGKLVRS